MQTNARKLLNTHLFHPIFLSFSPHFLPFLPYFSAFSPYFSAFFTLFFSFVFTLFSPYFPTFSTLFLCLFHPIFPAFFTLFFRVKKPVVQFSVATQEQSCFLVGCFRTVSNHRTVNRKPQGCHFYTHRNMHKILSDQTEIRLYLPCTD